MGERLEHQDGVGRKVDVPEAEAAQLPDPDAGRVQELQDRTVTPAHGVDRRWSGKQPVDLAWLQHHRQALGPAGNPQSGGRVVGDQPTTRQVAEA